MYVKYNPSSFTTTPKIRDHRSQHTKAIHPGTDKTFLDEWVDMSQCSDILNGTDNKLPFSAANSMNQISSCLSAGDNWTADNYELYNIATPTCTYGYDEKCTLNYPAENNPTCPHQLGSNPALTSAPVYNINYPNTGMAAVSLATS